jgi:DUF4097 and DUF4098 domain-containing protein YvlB
VSFRHRDDGVAGFSLGREGGFGSLLRSLLAGVPWSEKAEREEVLHFSAPPSRNFRIHNANGKTCVVGEDRDDIEVRALKNARAESPEAAAELLDSIRIIHGLTGDVAEIEVDIPSKWNRRGYAHLAVHVPKSLSTEIIAANGKIAVRNVQGTVRARSSNGSVELAGIRGDIEIATSNAKVCCCDTEGRLVARSSNGKIELSEHRGSVDASTSNGLIRASIEGMGREGVSLATSNGRIVLELPEQVDADVDIRVDNGVIRNDRTLCKAMRERSGQLRGRLGSGGCPIKLRTSNGSVCLR